MSEQFNYQEHLKRNKLFREMDIIISQYLFNKPCFMWWEVTNHDGCDMISYFDQAIESDSGLEPLYELKPGDWDYHENLIKEDMELKEENWKDGVHRWNLQKIPYYHSDLNLILQCEQKLIELNLQKKYTNRLIELIMNTDQNYKLFGPVLHHDLVKFLTISSEDRTYCLVDVIKEHFNVSE